VGLGIAFKFLHVATMFSAVTLSVAPSLILERIAASGDVRVTRGFLDRTAFLERLVPASFLLGALFGLLTAVTIGFDLLAPWLLIAYGLFAGISLLQATLGATWRRSLARSVATTGTGDATSAALVQAAGSLAGRVVNWFTAASVGLIVFDMVVKPLS
jgi:hypothetical protein